MKIPSHSGKLLGGYLAGIVKRNFKQVDYGLLQESVKQQRASGQNQLLRVKKWSKTSKKSKENALLKAHHEAWDRMHAQVVGAKLKSQANVEMWKSKVLEDKDEELKSFVLECTDLESRLYEERLEFERDTVDPIWSLRIDLKGWLEGNSYPEERERSVPGREEILQQLKLVKEQQNRIQAILDAEFDMIQSDLDVVVSKFLSDELSNQRMVDRGIPQEALDLACPDPELKGSVLQEFLMVDGYYTSLLNQLEQSNKEALRYTCRLFMEGRVFCFMEGTCAWLIITYSCFHEQGLHDKTLVHK